MCASFYAILGAFGTASCGGRLDVVAPTDASAGDDAGDAGVGLVGALRGGLVDEVGVGEEWPSHRDLSASPRARISCATSGVLIASARWRPIRPTGMTTTTPFADSSLDGRLLLDGHGSCAQHSPAAGECFGVVAEYSPIVLELSAASPKLTQLVLQS